MSIFDAECFRCRSQKFADFPLRARGRTLEISDPLGAQLSENDHIMGRYRLCAECYESFGLWLKGE